MYLAPLTRPLRWLGLLLLLLASATVAHACTIPVFRYALERWELSPYELLVFHRGELPAEASTFLDALPRHANLIVTPVDLDAKLEPPLRKLWQKHGRTATLPWVIVRRPDGGAKAPPVWTGPLDPARLRRLVDSPIRRRAVAALSEGSSGVFVLLLSGEHAADSAAQKLVQQQLTRLEKLVKLPEQRGEGPRIRLALPLQVAFTVLPLKRDEPGEDEFIRLLLGSEDDLAAVRGPIVFPIFGRGRLLGSLSGQELDADNLLEVVSFLCGECSCQVKELNPGMDLPIVADWPAVFARIGPAPESGPEAPAGATRLGARAKPLTGLLPIAAGASKASEASAVRVALSHYPPEEAPRLEPVSKAEPPQRRWLWWATLAAGGLVVLSGGWIAARWIGRRPDQEPAARG